MFHYSLRVVDEPKMSEIRILNLCQKKLILVDIYGQSLLKHIISQGFFKIVDSLDLPYVCTQGVPQHGSNVREMFL